MALKKPPTRAALKREAAWFHTDPGNDTWTKSYTDEKQENSMWAKKCLMWLHLGSQEGPQFTYVKYSVFGVVLMLNSATGTPLDATRGPNMAAGYTIEDVPTWSRTFLKNELSSSQTVFNRTNWAGIDKLTTRQRSQISISFSTLVRMWESRVSPKNTTLGLNKPWQSLSSHLNRKKNHTFFWLTVGKSYFAWSNHPPSGLLSTILTLLAKNTVSADLQ